MNRTIVTVMLLVLVSLLGACSTEQLKRTGYEALYQNQCQRDTGLPYCDMDYPDYDEYQAIREAELKGERIDR